MREIVEGLERENKALRSRVRLEEAGALPGNNGGGKEHSPLCGDDGEAAREGMKEFRASLEIQSAKWHCKYSLALMQCCMTLSTCGVTLNDNL